MTADAHARPGAFPSRTGAVASAGMSGAERVVSLRSARDLIDLRFAEPIDLDRMAAEAGYSRFLFARAFKDTYGETPANCLTRRRSSGPRTCCARPT